MKRFAQRRVNVKNKIRKNKQNKIWRKKRLIYLRYLLHTELRLGCLVILHFPTHQVDRKKVRVRKGGSTKWAKKISKKIILVLNGVEKLQK